jgi:hypothetical protein
MARSGLAPAELDVRRAPGAKDCPLGEKLNQARDQALAGYAKLAAEPQERAFILEAVQHTLNALRAMRGRRSIDNFNWTGASLVRTALADGGVSSQIASGWAPEWPKQREISLFRVVFAQNKMFRE